jgi:UDP-N-acetylmuramoylalanine--D-glutamate ligase
VRLADLSGRSVAVWGSGREGRAAVIAIAAHAPSRLIAVDDTAHFLDVTWDDEVAARAPLAGGEHAHGALVSADVVVRSAEVPRDHPWLADLRERRVQVVSGDALWMAERASRTVGVTGGPGVGHTAALIGHLLTAAGRPNVVGAAGVPLLDLPEADLYVLELAGGECADLADAPRVAVIVSLAPEPSAELAFLARGPELIVANGADPALMAEIKDVRDASGWAPIAVATADSRFRIGSDSAVYASDTRLFPRDASALSGEHDGEYLCVALAVLDGMGVDVVDVRSVLEKAVAAFPAG